MHNYEYPLKELSPCWTTLTMSVISSTWSYLLCSLSLHIYTLHFFVCNIARRRESEAGWFRNTRSIRNAWKNTPTACLYPRIIFIFSRCYISSIIILLYWLYIISSQYSFSESVFDTYFQRIVCGWLYM